MIPHKVHRGHDHSHGPGCGHQAITHEDHTDFLHDGHLHHPHDGRVDEHVIAISDLNPFSCTPTHKCSGHEHGHLHGPNCGHEPVPHGDHLDFLVDGHLHFPHHAHCDDHGEVRVA